MSGQPWFAHRCRRFLERKFGAGARLEESEVDWDGRAVCRATLAGGRRAVVKIDTDPIRHGRETRGLLAAGGADAPVPQVWAHGHGDGVWFLVLEEIPSCQSFADGVGSWRRAGAAARALHDTPIPPEMDMFCAGTGSWEQHIDHRVAVECEAAVDRGLLSDLEADAVRRYSGRLLAEAGPASRVLVHGDLQARHLLVAGERVVIVDFGDVGWGDPAMDLVVLTHFASQHRDDVLLGYGADDALRARVELLGPLYSLWRNLFVSRWYFENEFEQWRNTEALRRVLETVVLPGDRLPGCELDCDGVILDFDGVVVDAQYASWRSWQELCGRYGRTLDLETWADRCHDDPMLMWRELAEFAGRLLDSERLELARQRHRDALLTVLPGVREFVARCADKSLEICLVSNLPRTWLRELVDVLGLDRNLLERVVTCENPPDSASNVYQLALSTMSVGTDRAIAFVASERSLDTAGEAGLRCIAVPNRVTAHAALAKADAVLETLGEVEFRSRAEIAS